MERLLEANNDTSNKVSSLRISVEGLTARISILEKTSPSSTPTMLAPPPQRPNASRPDGHRSAPPLQGDVTREIRTSGHTLVRGKPSRTTDPFPLTFDDNFEEENFAHRSPRSHSGPRLPKSDFPSFDANNPK